MREKGSPRSAGLAATLAELKSMGKLVTTQRFAGTSVVWIVDLTLPPDGPPPEGDCVYIP